MEFLPISFEGMSWHIQRPVYSLFTAAALFYLDIPHKNSIELCSVGCSLAAFEDEIFAGVFSGQRPASLTVHMEQHHSSKLTTFTVRAGAQPSFSWLSGSICHFIECTLRFYVVRPAVYLPARLVLLTDPSCSPAVRQVEASLCLPSNRQSNPT